MKKLTILAIAALVVALMVLGGGQAVASTPPPPPACSDFSLVQTYYALSGFYRAPAWYYGQTVTIDYQATNCNFFVQGSTFNLRLVGTATVYAGTSATGDPIDVRPFQNTETWNDPTNDWGWPWWGTSDWCNITRAHYQWTIPGVYIFVAHKTPNGDFTYQQTAFTRPPSRSSGVWVDCTP